MSHRWMDLPPRYYHNTAFRRTPSRSRTKCLSHSRRCGHSGWTKHQPFMLSITYRTQILSRIFSRRGGTHYRRYMLHLMRRIRREPHGLCDLQFKTITSSPPSAHRMSSKSGTAIERHPRTGLHASRHILPSCLQPTFTYVLVADVGGIAMDASFSRHLLRRTGVKGCSAWIELRCNASSPGEPFGV